MFHRHKCYLNKTNLGLFGSFGKIKVNSMNIFPCQTQTRMNIILISRHIHQRPRHNSLLLCTRLVGQCLPAARGIQITIYRFDFGCYVRDEHDTFYPTHPLIPLSSPAPANLAFRLKRNWYCLFWYLENPSTDCNYNYYSYSL